MKLEKFVSKFSVHCSKLLCTMYQKVGKPFADFILFKVDKWVANFKFWLVYRNRKEVSEPNADFTLFIVGNGNADFRKYLPYRH